MKKSYNIRPITDLRNTTEISESCHKTNEPIYITKNGYSDLVIMSQEAYDAIDLKPVNTEASLAYNNKPLRIVDNERNYGLVRVKTVAMSESVGNPANNARLIIEEARKANEEEVDIVMFPELSLTGYSCLDYFFQSSLLIEINKCVKEILEETKDLKVIMVFGSPFLYNQKLFNSAFVIQEGKILGVVPKTYLPNYDEFYEKRHFVEALDHNEIVSYLGQEIPFGNRLIFVDINRPHFKFALEICEDLWAPLSPSLAHATNGATLILNISASNETLDKTNDRRDLVRTTSLKLLSAYAYVSSIDESTTDLVYGGKALASELGELLAENELFTRNNLIVDFDLERIILKRQKDTTFKLSLDQRYIFVPFESNYNLKSSVTRDIADSPFVPKDQLEREQWCDNAINLQAQGLSKRLKVTNISKLVLGLSGGLDSTLALIVALETAKIMGLDRKDIYAFSLPCFGTSNRTKNNARVLSELIGVSFEEVDITDSVNSHLNDLKQPSDLHDITYENAQARERTQFLFDKANQLNALVIGTGDLSELALGYCTYNGDQMSSYAINSSLPKTFIRAVVDRYSHLHHELTYVLQDILNTPISPELLPGVQNTEDIVGPYELHDFYLYNLIKNCFSIEKIGYLAIAAFKDKYIPTTIIKWLEVFVRRFYSQQFKRSAMPDGVKVSPVSLSPRGDFKLPSDLDYKGVLEEIEVLKRKYCN